MFDKKDGKVRHIYDIKGRSPGKSLLLHNIYADDSLLYIGNPFSKSIITYDYKGIIYYLPCFKDTVYKVSVRNTEGKYFITLTEAAKFNKLYKEAYRYDIADDGNPVIVVYSPAR